MTTKEQVLEIIEKLRYKPSTQTTDAEQVLYDLIQQIEFQVQEPKIKQLEWSRDTNVVGIIYRTTTRPMDCISYRIEKIKNTYLLYSYVGLNANPLVFESEDQAKAYAQEHFEGLIRECYQ